MRRVITVSLNGNAFQVEDDAYAALSSYLEAAERALANNPDRAEIIADLEQAIADKSARFLSAHRSVLAAAELQQILAEMGPVDGVVDAGLGASAAPAGGGPTAGSAESAPRRLYQISDGAKISGVCMGLAAYFGIDVTIVRLAFVLTALVTGGTAILVYLVLMFVVPYAQTSEEHAAAHGLPFNARALVERAKQQAADFASHQDWRRSRDTWKREWRASRAAWKASWRRSRADWRAAPSPPPPPAAPSPAPGPARPPFVAHVLTGIVLAVLGVVLAVFTVVWVLAIVSLATTGAILGVLLPVGIPFWIAILVLVLIYSLVAWPIKALRHATYGPSSGYHGSWVAPWDGIAALALIGALAWYGYHHVVPLHDFIDHVLHSAQHTIDA